MMTNDWIELNQKAEQRLSADRRRVTVTNRVGHKYVQLVGIKFVVANEIFLQYSLHAVLVDKGRATSRGRHHSFVPSRDQPFSDSRGQEVRTPFGCHGARVNAYH
jgi:hypothetical protein